MGTSEVIHFDSDYMRDRAKIVAQAGEAIDEAIECLRKANRHDGWQCVERAEINGKLDEMKKRLANIKDNAVTPVSTALSRGADQFADLEARSEAQEKQVAEQMRRDWGFKPSPWQKITGAISGWITKLWGGDESSKTALPVIQVPKLPDRTTTAAPEAGASASLTKESTVLNFDSLRPTVGNWQAPESPEWIHAIVNKLFGR